MRVAVNVVDALGIECARAAHDAVHVVALGEQQLSEIRSVLPGHAGDEGFFGRCAHEGTSLLAKREA